MTLRMYGRQCLYAALVAALFCLGLWVLGKTPDEGGVFAVFAVSVFLVNYLFFRRMRREFSEMKTLVAMPQHRQAMDAYIASLRDFRDRVKTPAIAEMMRIHIAAALSECDRQQEAIAEMDAVDMHAFDRKNRAIAARNMALIRYFLRDYGKADALVDAYPLRGAHMEQLIGRITEVLRHQRDTADGLRALDALRKEADTKEARQLIQRAKEVLFRDAPFSDGSKRDTIEPR